MGTNDVCRLNKLSFIIINSVEKFYYRLGVKIANNPFKTILLCWICVLVCFMGFFRFHYEKNPLNLWVPPNSNFYHDTKWLMKQFKQALRPEFVIITAPNVLTPEVFKKVGEIDNSLKTSQTALGVSLKDICLRVPVDNLIKDRTKRDIKSLVKNQLDTVNSMKVINNFDPSISLHSSLYCAIARTLKMGCLQINILDLWDFDTDKLNSLTEEDILNEINTSKTSSLLQYPYEDLLGNIKRNSSGHIISAESLLSIWMVNVNFTDLDMDVSGNKAGTADWATEPVLLWEQEFLNTLKHISNTTKDMNVYYESGRSYGDISEATMFQDMGKLVIGITLMVIYVQIVISKYNCIEFRTILGCFGLLCVGMAFISGCGICSLLGISYGPVHTSLPFLLMGLGVDDMFILVASWEQLSSNKQLCLPKRIGHMLQHAGMSVTITSLTDVMAFLVGASTVLPSLRSFCLFAAFGVLMTFLFTVVFFTACFVLDQRRIENFQNSFFPWYHHKQPYTFNECSRKRHTNTYIRFIYAKLILTKPGKLVVILITISMVAWNTVNLLKLEQRFDPNWFIPDHTYLHRYLEYRNTYYPSMGYEGGIYFGALNYSNEIKNIHELALDLQNKHDILNNVKTWTTPFIKYIHQIDNNINPFMLSDSDWKYYISKFLYSPKGARFRANFRFKGELQCGEQAPEILVSSIDFRFNVFAGPKQHLPAMHTLQNTVSNVNLTTGDKFVTVWAQAFANWVTDEIIDTEVIRNLLLALLCVMACTLILITNFQMCFWIFLCVLLTMVNVCGCMQRLGLTIDLVACIGLQLAVGLCVDYATHIGHSFLLIENGSRFERTLEAVTYIGAAVLYGGGSTFLALSLLSLSESYIFKSFFKIFSLVIAFGLFHGIVFLPVVLSVIGPSPYNRKCNEENTNSDTHKEQVALNSFEPSSQTVENSTT